MSTRRERTHERGKRYCRQPDNERKEDHRYLHFSRDRYDEEAGKRKSRSPHNQDRKKRRKQRSFEKKKSRKSSRNSDDYSYDSYSPSRRRYDGNDEHYYNQRHDEEIRDRTRRRRRRRRRRTNNHKRKNDRNSRRRRRSLSTETYSSRDSRLHRHLEVNAGAAIPRTGVVSDDEDDYGHHQERQSPGKHHHIKKNPSSPAHDDTVGHFKGREGCIIADRYRILKEVGMGTFGRVVECLDLSRQRRVDYYRQQQSEDSHHRHHRSYVQRHDDDQNSIVAIKIVRNVKRYYESAIIEADIIEDVNRRGRRGRTHCAILYDTFSFHGHYCIVFESLGPSLYDFLKGHKYHPFPIHCVYDFTLQLLETVEYLHSFRIIHTDLKPENILLLNGREIPQRGGYSIPESTRIKVIDFGGATYDNEKKSSIVNTRQYRAPEVILNVGWGAPSDLWSIGCILVELYQGELLFATHDNIEHLALIEQVVGPFPRRMLKRAKNVELVNEAFDSNGAHRMVLLAEKLAYVKQIAPLESIVYYEDEWFLQLLRRILIIDPDERYQAQQLLRFLEKGAHPKLGQDKVVKQW